MLIRKVLYFCIVNAPVMRNAYAECMRNAYAECMRNAYAPSPIPIPIPLPYPLREKIVVV